MTVPRYHFLHGAVLNIICKRDKPTSITLIEAAEESWGEYVVNGKTLFVKYSQTMESHPGTGERVKWSFNINQNLINRFVELQNQKKYSLVWCAFVCAEYNLTSPFREIALLSLNEVVKLYQMKNNNENPWIAVHFSPRTQLHITGSSDRKGIVIPRSRIYDF